MCGVGGMCCGVMCLCCVVCAMMRKINGGVVVHVRGVVVWWYVVLCRVLCIAVLCAVWVGCSVVGVRGVIRSITT